ncbi:MAG: hypothetical protein ACREJ3_08505, partial [Polyangiaceae bacterium]
MFRGISLSALIAGAAACSSASTGDNVTCGAGTSLDGSVCYGMAPSSKLEAGVVDARADASAPVADAMSGGDAADTGADAGAQVSPVMFSGVTALAPASATSLLVTWGKATDADFPDGGAVFTYRVYLATSPGGENFMAPTVESAPGASSVLIDSGLSVMTQYYVVVRAVDAAGNEDANTTEMSATTQVDTMAPVFAGVTAVASAPQASLAISWQAATDNLTPAAGIVYDVYLATTSGGENFNVPDAVSAPGALSVTVSGLPEASTTYYVV